MPEERSTNSKYLNLTFYTTGSSLMFDFLDRMMNKENNKDFQMASFLIYEISDTSWCRRENFETEIFQTRFSNAKTVFWERFWNVFYSKTMQNPKNNQKNWSPDP